MTELEAEQAWQGMKSGFHDIFLKRSGCLSFEELYRSAYNLVIHKHGKKLYAGVKDLVHDRVTLIAHDLRNLPDGEEFLIAVGGVWQEFNNQMRMISDVLMYMDRNFVVQQKQLNTKEMSLRIFQEIVLMDSEIGVRLIRALMKQIDVFRDSKAEKCVLHCADIVDAYMTCRKAPGCKDLIAELVVGTFIQKTFEYYSRKARKSYEDDEELYCDEASRAYQFEAELMKSIGLPLNEEGLNKAWIECNYKEIISWRLGKMMKQLQEGDQLKTMYSLYCKSDQASKYMLHLFREEVHAMISSEPENIKTTIQKLNHLKNIITRSGLGKDYISELRAEAESVFDKGTGVCKALAEWIVKNTITSSEMDSVFESFFVIFRYIVSKDIFELFYRSLLAKRLLSSSSPSSTFDPEVFLINKLKHECGASYTTKLEGMLADLESSSQLSREWGRETCMQPIILSSSIWSQFRSFTMPQSPLPASFPSDSISAFERFYGAKFQGRKLTWIHSHGTAEVRFSNFDATNFVILAVTTLQAFILSFFNQHDSLTLNFICESLKLTPEQIRKHLLSLYVNPKCRILVKDQNDTFSVNAEFFDSENKKYLKVPLIVDNGEDSFSINDFKNNEVDTGAGTEQVVLEDRKHLIEAAIVRIMKSKRQLHQNSLVIELSNILENRFLPSPNMIKDRIDNLIDREFIARDNDDVKLYYYVA